MRYAAEVSNPNPVGLASDVQADVQGSGDSRLGSEDRASILAFVEGNDFLDLLDATGDTIHGIDPTQ